MKPHTWYYQDGDQFIEVGTERRPLPMYRTDAEGGVIIFDGKTGPFTVPNNIKTHGEK